MKVEFERSPLQVFHLNLKRKWFDMILSGEKKEEYREIKPYWNNRFKEGHFKKGGIWHPAKAMVLCFSNGYSADAPRIYFSVTSISKKKGREDWGALPNQIYWVLSLEAKVYP